MNNYKFRKQVINEYAKQVKDHIRHTGDAYILTFMFQPLHGGDYVIVQRQLDAIDAFYARLVTRYNKEPNSPFQQHLNPKLIVCPDRPIFKHDKEELIDVTMNNGLHLHAIALEMTRSRRDLSMKEVIAREHHRFAKPPFMRIHVRKITHHPYSVVGYALKAYRAGLFDEDYFRFYPKSVSELPGFSFRSHEISLMLNFA